MSKKMPSSFSKLNTSCSSFPPKLQTNVSLLNQTNARVIQSRRPNSAVKKSKLDDQKDLARSAKLSGEFKVQTDSSENDNNSGRPDVLSIDSDLSSSNDIGDSPDHETEPSLNSTLKQQNLASDIIDFNKLSLNGRESLKALSAEYSYCTPPRVLNDEKVLEKKKGEQSRAFFSPRKLRSLESATVSNSHRHSAKALHASSTNKADDRIVSEIERQSAVNDQSSDRRREALQQRSGEVMDMKFTDLTHMQLKRSLDQIHGQNLRGHITNPYSEFLLSGSGGQSNTNVCYSHPINENANLPHTVGSRIVGVYSNPAIHSYEPGFYNNVGMSSSAPQSSKFDSILQAKDAMLQEKETVILKLRLQVSSLQHQIQESEATLRQVVGSHIPTSCDTKILPASTNQASDLQTRKKIYDLEQLLGKAETKLVEKTSYFKSERKEMEDHIEKLQKSLKTQEQSHSTLSKKHKSTAERLEKYKKRVESLERYLGDLPTIEESNKLKTEAGLLGEERECLVLEISTLKNKLEENVKIISKKDMDIKQLESEKAESQSRLKKLEEKFLKSEKSKKELGRTERDELEDFRYEVARLQKEREDAGLMVAGCEKRIKQLQEKHKVEMTKLQGRITDSEEMAESLRRELFLKQQASNKVHTAVMNLSSQNQQLLEEKLSLQDKVKNLEKLHSNMRDASRASYRLQRESACALQDLKAVTQVLLETAKGADPNISALLGVRNDSISGEDDFNYQPGYSVSEDSADIGVETALSVEQNNKRLLEVRKLRQEIDHLRTLLSNQYAETIGDNCITQ